MTSLVIENLRGAIVGPVYLTVSAGTCAAITGPSGAGKSLFLRMIADLDPSEGEVAIGDIRRSAVPAPAWRARAMHVAAEAGWWAEQVDAHFSKAAPARSRARHSGAAQPNPEPGLFKDRPTYTDPGSPLRSVRDDEDVLGRAKDLAARLGLAADDFQRQVRTLSTGERQRLALVRALVRRPACLLLDEPTSALDPASIEKAEALLREAMAGGTIIVLVSHDPAQAERLATARYVMQAGRLYPEFLGPA